MRFLFFLGIKENHLASSKTKKQLLTTKWILITLISTKYVWNIYLLKTDVGG